MTRKDYIQTANILKSFAQDIPQTIYEDLVDQFCQLIAPLILAFAASPSG